MSRSTTLDAVLRAQAALRPQHRFLFRPLQDLPETEVEPITYGIFDAHVSRLASRWADLKQAAGPDSSVIEPQPAIVPKAVVGVLLPSGYTLCVAMFALMRLGAAAFCLSPRNSDEALRHLVKAGNVSIIIAANDAEDNLADRMRSVLKEGDLHATVIGVGKSDVSDLAQGPYTPYPPVPEGTITKKDIAIQQHTSGSTAFPKPVPLSNELLLRAVQGGTWWVDDLHNETDIRVGQPPIFHMFGLMGGLLNSLFRGHTFAIPPLPASDAAAGMIPSPRTLYTLCKAQFEAGSEGIEFLKSMKRVLVGGAPIPRENGDWIVSQGVHLIEGFGSTEGGSLMHSNRPRGDPNWQAMRVNWNVPHEFRPFGNAPGTDIPLFELILQSTEEWGWFSGSDPVTGQFNTHDLQACGRYRHYGRSDDVLLLSTGQSWNPRPMELRIEGSPAIRHAVVFGHAKPRLGALIEPKDASCIDADGIWAAVEEANSVAPSNARIAKRDVLLKTDKGVTFLARDGSTDVIGGLDGSQSVKAIPIADKGTPLRPKTYLHFKEEIDRVYNDVL
ncbi:hypothetical protein BKA70DRAFT_1300995 [Coprinopsis sp. MPI-PUGE-AT-0042]|nr:hypothetical protein BKA70DRAFT_1300995 [Coprinopsis sp. MPI-PUGE-AT-0042]